MPNPPNENASRNGGAEVDSASGLEATLQNFLDGSKFSIKPDILANKSTATEIQLQKVITLLCQGPKTTMDLRAHGIMMPAARVFQLKNEHDLIITSQWVTLYDENGYKHSKCARYSLVGKRVEADPQCSLNLGVR
jgi:hypothetical protein